MRSQYSSRTNRSRRFRRGVSLAEVVIAALLVVLVMSGVASTLSIAARMEQVVTLQGDTSASAATAMNRISLDVREAKSVTVVDSTHFRVYKPIVNSDGHYDRFQTDTTHYTDYALSTSSGTASTTGTYLWRKSESDAGRLAAKNVSLFTVTATGTNAVRISLNLTKTSGNRTVGTNVTQRVLYMRNN